MQAHAPEAHLDLASKPGQSVSAAAAAPLDRLSLRAPASTDVASDKALRCRGLRPLQERAGCRPDDLSLLADLGLTLLLHRRPSSRRRPQAQRMWPSMQQCGAGSTATASLCQWAS